MTFNETVNRLVDANQDRDLIIISQEITKALHYSLSILLADKKKDKVTVFLTTTGGDPNGGYRVARCLQHHYEHIRLVIPSLCKSAGTLIAVGSHELVIGDLGELGPLDVQVRKTSELLERSSGLDLIQALEVAQSQTRDAFHNMLIEIRRGGRLSTKLAGEFAAEVATGVAAPLYNQIDPNRLGEMQRAIRIAIEYGKRLNGKSQNLKNGALEALVGDYPSHSFVIDRKEARDLFNNVSAPTKEEDDFGRILWHVLGEETGHGPLFIHRQGEPDGRDTQVQNAEPAPQQDQPQQPGDVAEPAAQADAPG